MPTISKIIWKTVVRPMRTTFATSLGSKTCATSVIVTVCCEDGSVGVGEVPTSFVLPHETAAAISGVLAEVRPALCGKSIQRWASLAGQVRRQFPRFHMTASGLEVALFRAWLAGQDKSEWQFWGGKTETLQTDITIPFVPDIKALEPWILRAIRTGFNTYKVKVSGKVKTDLDFCRAVYGYLNDAGKPFVVRLDGNQGFSAKSALDLLDKLGRAGLAVELFEQPLVRDDDAGLKTLTKHASVPIIADETVFCEDDCKRVIEQRLADGVNIKIAKSGIAESRKIYRLARQAGLKLMLGCMTETMVGLSAAICFAAGTGGFDYIDLDSVHFLRRRDAFEGIGVDGCVFRLGGTR
jgi:L-alanine-DL-glutamate epimerase-like enolase superfamily enzyme